MIGLKATRQRRCPVSWSILSAWLKAMALSVATPSEKTACTWSADFPTKRGSSANSLPLNLMILDDPTQSLATPQKERLAEVIDEVAESRQVIIATMDAEFFEALRSRVTKRKRVYEFRSWTPADGPEIVDLD